MALTYRDWGMEANQGRPSGTGFGANQNFSLSYAAAKPGAQSAAQQGYSVAPQLLTPNDVGGGGFSTTRGAATMIGSAFGPIGTAVGLVADIGSEVLNAVMKYNDAKKQEAENKRVEKLNRALMRDEKEYQRTLDAERRERQKEINAQNKAISQYNQHWNFIDRFMGTLNRRPQVAMAMQKMWRN